LLEFIAKSPREGKLDNFSKMFKMLRKNGQRVITTANRGANNFDDIPEAALRLLAKMGQSSSSASISRIRKLASDIDDRIDKIPVTEILTTIAESTKDPKVAEVAKILAKNSPKIAVAIATCVLTAYGIPAYSVIPQAAGIVAQGLTKSGTATKEDASSDQSMVSQYVPLIGNMVQILAQHITEQNAASLELKSCSKCSSKNTVNASFCINCGSPQVFR
jgi:hypothetical protein